MTSEVLFSQKNQLGIITLSRPQALNALTLPMIKALQQQLTAWRSDETIQAVVITGAGDKAFCAGGDVRWLYETGHHHTTEAMSFFWHEYRLNHCIHHYPKPYIALLDGITRGGGVGVSLHGSHPIASERFKFAMPETSIGFFPDIGASHLLSRCSGESGVYLGLTGNRLCAAEAYFCGLVKAVVPSAQFSALLESLTVADLRADPFGLVDACIAPFANQSSEGAKTPIESNLSSINACFSAKTVEAIATKLAECQTDWATTVNTDLLAKSPLSLKVTLEQLRRAKSLSMAECITMDYSLVGHFMRGHDFYEGVRALLVDKDKAPQWQPSVLSQVGEGLIAEYFECDGNALTLIEVI